MKKMKKLAITVLMVLAMASVVSAQTYYSLRSRTHATDCTALTDGKINDICFEVDDETLYKCEPDAGDCTGTEWKFIGGAETVTKCIVIETPADADDFLMYHVEKGAQVVAAHCIVESATSATLSFEQCDVAGDTCSDITSDIICDVGGQADDGVIDAPDLDIDDWIRVNVVGAPTGTPGHVTGCVSFVMDE